MIVLEYVRVYLEDLLVLTKDSFNNELEKFRVELAMLLQASLICRNMNEYLGYVLTHEHLKPLMQKVQAIKALKQPTSVKQL